MTTFNQIFQKNQYNLNDITGKSQKWYGREVEALSSQRITPHQLTRANVERNVSVITPGELYMFSYNAKHKDTLPLWDKFPLVFPFRRHADGFTGLNMHYLPYAARIYLLDQLMEYRSNNKMDDTTRLKFSWSTIMSVSNLKIAEPCVHRYLSSHVVSHLKKVNANEWATAMMLPVEQFVSQGKRVRR